MELIGEVFSVGGDEVKRMIKERMAGKGMIKEKKTVQKKEKSIDRKKDGSKKRAKKDAPPAGLSEEAAE
jgi:type IV secretory pathway TrbL component